MYWIGMNVNVTNSVVLTYYAYPPPPPPPPGGASSYNSICNDVWVFPELERKLDTSMIACPRHASVQAGQRKYIPAQQTLPYVNTSSLRL